MKQYEYENLDEDLSADDLANIFNVYEDDLVGNFYLTYNINRTFNVTGRDNASPTIYDVYTVKENDTWTLISYNYYHTTRLWWLVCKMNGVTDPTVQPTAGDRIKLLREDYVRDVLRSIKLS